MKGIYTLLVLISFVFINLGAQTINLPLNLHDPSEELVIVKDNLTFCEGPAFDSQGNLFWTDEINVNNRRSKLWKKEVGREPVIIRDNANGANGLVFDSEDQLYAAEWGGITRMDRNGNVSSIVTTSGRPNDLCLTPEMGIFFTCPVWNGRGDVKYLSPEGNLKKIVENASGYPNGIQYIEDKDLLYIAWSQQGKITKYKVDEQKNIGEIGDLVTSLGTPDGFAIDELGNVWIAEHTGNKVTVVDSTGNNLGSISFNQSIQNCVFGGPDNSTLAITGARTVFTINLKVRGRIPATVSAKPFHVATRKQLPSIKNSGAGVFRIIPADEFENSLLRIFSMKGELVYSMRINTTDKNGNLVLLQNGSGNYIALFTSNRGNVTIPLQIHR